MGFCAQPSPRRASRSPIRPPMRRRRWRWRNARRSRGLRSRSFRSSASRPMRSTISCSRTRCSTPSRRRSPSCSKPPRPSISSSSWARRCVTRRGSTIARCCCCLEKSSASRRRAICRAIASFTRSGISRRAFTSQTRRSTSRACARPSGRISSLSRRILQTSRSTPKFAKICGRRSRLRRAPQWRARACCSISRRATPSSASPTCARRSAPRIRAAAFPPISILRRGRGNRRPISPGTARR